MNPYDEFALEEALRLKEKFGEGSVTAVTVGPDAARETLRSALAMGADEGVLLRSAGSHDGLAVARALADEIATREYDLILFGKQAIDDDGMQVPAMVAQLLSLPCATVVVDLQIEGGTATAKREIEGGHEIVVYPNPYRANLNQDYLTIAGLPETATIQIFSSTGRLLRTLEENDGNGGIDWDLKNEADEEVPSGIYIYSVKSGDQSTKGKFAVIR
jgi:hypothetical protein